MNFKNSRGKVIFVRSFFHYLAKPAPRLKLSFLPFSLLETVARREEIAAIRKERNFSIPEKCKTDFDPPISEEVLVLMPSYLSALKSGSAFTERSWKTLAKKLKAERKGAETEYNSIQTRKRKLLQDAVDQKREERQKECQDNKTLEIINLAINNLTNDATEYVQTEAGALIIDPTLSASFLMETLGYVWRSWHQDNPGLPLSMRGIFYLWETLFVGLAIPDMEFQCKFCEQRAGFKAMLSHIAKEHGNSEESVISWHWARSTHKYTDFLDWDGAVWPEVLPFLPAGSKFTPRQPCDERRWCRAKSYPVVKQSKGWKSSTATETTSLRLSIVRCLRLVNELDVPPIFKLAAFLANLSKEENFSRPHDLNSVYYEILRAAVDHDVGFLSNEKIFCKICVENETLLLINDHPGHGSFLQLIGHFCEEHYAIVELEKPEGLNWRKDMILLPGPKDIKSMYDKLPDAMSKKWDRVNETTGLDLESCKAKIEEEEYVGNRARSLPMSSWKYNKLLISQPPPTPVSPGCGSLDPLNPAFWDMANIDIRMDFS